jgi:hypothetical protein
MSLSAAVYTDAKGLAKEMGGDAKTAAMPTLAKAASLILSGQSVSSLADVGRPARVEPLVLVDQSLVPPGPTPEHMTDVMKTTLSIFIGYWMQAATMLGTNVGRLDTLRLLDALNPNRSNTVGSNVKDAVFSKESYAFGLPSLESFNQPMEHNLVVEVGGEVVSQESEEEAPKGTSVGVDSGDVSKFYEIPSLTLGKLISVELTDGKNKGRIPVQFRLLPTRIPSPTLVHILTATAKNQGVKERYHLWRAGQISFVKDLIFASDLIDQHRKALVNDTSNVYLTMTERRKRNLSSAYASGTPSMADASNVAVISTETARAVEREMGGKLSSSRTRKRLFDESYLLLMVVVDERWERVTIYHRGLEQPTEASFRELKVSEKGKGPDITEFLKAYMQGASVSI